MSKNTKTTWLRRMSVKVKLRAPVGIKLTTGETMALAEIYNEDAKKIRENESEVTKALSSTKTLDVSDSIEESQMAKSVAVATFKRTKDPIKRREWARRVVVADQAIKSMRGMKKRMSATHDRLTMIKGDLELQLMEAEARAQEAKAYAMAGKQLRLVGEKLINARTRAKTMKVEYDNLEITMEGAEQAISGKLDPEELLEEAERLSHA